MSATVNVPWQSEPTASRTINGVTVHARHVAVSAKHARTKLDSGRGYRTTSSVTSFADPIGVPALRPFCAVRSTIACPHSGQSASAESVMAFAEVAMLTVLDEDGGRLVVSDQNHDERHRHEGKKEDQRRQ